MPDRAVFVESTGSEVPEVRSCDRESRVGQPHGRDSRQDAEAVAQGGTVRPDHGEPHPVVSLRELDAARDALAGRVGCTRRPGRTYAPSPLRLHPRGTILILEDAHHDEVLVGVIVEVPVALEAFPPETDLLVEP